MVPGVLIIESLVQAASVLLLDVETESPATRVVLRGVNNARFRRQVVPGDQLVLVAKEVKFQRRRFACDAQGWVNGNMKFEVKCTGMRI